MIGSRRGRPSLIGRAAHTAARTAVIAGTATAVSGRVAAGQAAKSQAAGQTATPSPAEAAPPPSAGLGEGGIAQLKKLAELREAGILTEDEFAEQKARILA